MKKSQLIGSLSPELFSHREQLTGEEDVEFGGERALWRVQEHERAERAKSLRDT